jgi:hypothetical protein
MTRGPDDARAGPEAAAFVGSIADGNETVPTVVIDGEAVVNPSSGRVVAATRGR